MTRIVFVVSMVSVVVNIMQSPVITTAKAKK